MILTEANFLIFAAQHYTNVNCTSTEEWIEDLQRIKYIKRLFSMYRNKHVLRENLILNHIRILYNVFEPEALTKMLFFRLGDYGPYLKPFLLMMGFLPEKIEGIIDSETRIWTVDIPMDSLIVSKLREIIKSAGSNA